VARGAHARGLLRPPAPSQLMARRAHRRRRRGDGHDRQLASGTLHFGLPGPLGPPEGAWARRNFLGGRRRWTLDQELMGLPRARLRKALSAFPRFASGLHGTASPSPRTPAPRCILHGDRGHDVFRFGLARPGPRLAPRTGRAVSMASSGPIIVRRRAIGRRWKQCLMHVAAGAGDGPADQCRSSPRTWAWMQVALDSIGDAGATVARGRQGRGNAEGHTGGPILGPTGPLTPSSAARRIRRAARLDWGATTGQTEECRQARAGKRRPRPLRTAARRKTRLGRGAEGRTGENSTSPAKGSAGAEACRSDAVCQGRRRAARCLFRRGHDRPHF